MVKRISYCALLGGFALLFSCKNGPTKNHGPIVLGDSSSIVTETDPSKLQDLVTDLNPVIPSSEPRDTMATPPSAPKKGPDTPKKNPVTVAANPTVTLTGPGLKADFNVMSLLIPNVNAKQSGNGNLSNANGVVFTFISGTLNGNLLKVTANVTKVSQRYQSVVVLKNELGMLPIETLSTTTGWEALKGTSNIYRITGLDEKNLDYPEANKNVILNAVTRAAQRHHMSRKKIQQWQNSVHNVRAANQKPLYVMLRSVIWKIDGKDAQGKIFSKQVRIDFPM